MELPDGEPPASGGQGGWARPLAGTLLGAPVLHLLKSQLELVPSFL